MTATVTSITPGAYSSSSVIQGLSVPEHDRIDLTYTGSNVTQVVYKYSGNVVATLTLAYDGSNNLMSVTKS